MDNEAAGGDESWQEQPIAQLPGVDAGKGGVNMEALSDMQGIRASRLASMQADMVRQGVPVHVDAEALQGMQALLDMELQSGRSPVDLQRQPVVVPMDAEQESGAMHVTVGEEEDE